MEHVNPYAEKLPPVDKKARPRMLVKMALKWLLIILAIWAYIYFSQPSQRLEYARGFEYIRRGDFVLARNTFTNAFSQNPISKLFVELQKSYNKWILAGRNKLDTQ